MKFVKTFFHGLARRACTMMWPTILSSAHLSQSLANIVKLLEDCDDKIFSVGSEPKQLYASSSRVPHLPGSDIMHKLIVSHSTVVLCI